MIFRTKSVGVMKLKSPKDFVLNHIYRMNLGSRSHVKKPYYVEVIEIGNDFIKTSIPGEHSTIITKDSSNWPSNWDYHIGRFEYIGNTEKNRALIYNQKGLIITDTVTHKILGYT